MKSGCLAAAVALSVVFPAGFAMAGDAGAAGASAAGAVSVGAVAAGGSPVGGSAAASVAGPSGAGSGGPHDADAPAGQNAGVIEADRAAGQPIGQAAGDHAVERQPGEPIGQAAGASSGAGAETPAAGLTAKRVPVFSDDRVVTGINQRIDVFFEIGKNRRSAEGSSLFLSFGHSPVLIGELSYITVLMDDVPLTSIPLDATNAERGSASIPLSEVTLGPGWHKLSFRVQMNATLLACANPDSPANWLVLFRESRLDLLLADMTPEPDLAVYPSPFYEDAGSGPAGNPQTVMVLPDEPVHEELAAAARLVQFFSRQNAASRMAFAVYPESELPDGLADTRHVIWVGLEHRWKAAGRDMVRTMRETVLPPDWEGGFIGLMRTGGDDPRLQLVIAGNGAELARGAHILSDPVLYGQLRGAYSLLTEQPVKPQPADDPETGREVAVTFADMGYGRIVMENTLVGQAQIHYNLPANWEFSGPGRLRLAYAHSTSVNLTESVIAVKFNGIPVGSQYLRDSSGNRGLMDLELAPELLSQRRTLEIEVQVEFITAGLKPDDALEPCSDMSFIGHWAVIDPASVLVFTPAERRRADLASIPYPFAANGRWNDTAVVMAVRPGRETLSLLMTLIGIMGRDARDSSGLRFLPPDDLVPERTAGSHLIVIGEADGLPPELADDPDIPLRYGDGRVTGTIAGVEILDELQRRSVAVQLSASPYDERFRLLKVVVTEGGRPGMLTRALTDPEQAFALAGTLAIVDARGRVHAFAVPEARADASSADAAEEGRAAVKPAAFAVLALFFLAGMYLFIRRMLRH